MIGRGDPDVARRLVAKLTQRVDLRVDLIEVLSDPVEQSLASLCGRNSPRGAGQEPDAEPCLELANGVAQCGLRNATFAAALVKLRSLATARKT